MHLYIYVNIFILFAFTLLRARLVFDSTILRSSQPGDYTYIYTYIYLPMG